MKKFLVIFCLTSVISYSASAGGFFVGADALHSNSRHKVESSSGASANDGAVSQDNKYGYGASLGYRQDLLLWFGSAEVFYDNINDSSKPFDSSSGSGDSLKINDRYGVKVNAGMAIFPKISPFLTLGLANVNYDINGVSSNKNRNEFTPLYGVGVMIDLPLDLSLKVTYDYQQFNANNADNSAKFKTNLGVAKVGLVYSF